MPDLAARLAVPLDPELMPFLKSCGGAFVGATVGTAVWLGASMLLNGHLPALALLVGGLTGLAVNRTSQSSDSRLVPALIALITTLVFSLAAKYSVMATQWVPENREFWDVASASSIDEDAMISTMADNVVLERQARGETIDWPDPGMTFEDATWPEDYPVEIWEEGRRRWQEMTAAEQQTHRDARAAEVAAVISGYHTPQLRAALRQSIGIWDFIWLGAALATAFALGGRFVLAG